MKEIRKASGLGQHDMAVLLGLSRGMLSMVESGRRQLPSAAWLKLVALQELWKSQQSPKKSALDQSPEIRKELQKMLRHARIKERRAQRDLKRLQKQVFAHDCFRSCREASVHNAHLISHNATGQSPDPRLLCRLEIKVATLKAECEIIEARLADTRDPREG